MYFYSTAHTHERHQSCLVCLRSKSGFVLLVVFGHKTCKFYIQLIHYLLHSIKFPLLLKMFAYNQKMLRSTRKLAICHFVICSRFFSLQRTVQFSSSDESKFSSPHKSQLSFFPKSKLRLNGHTNHKPNVEVARRAIA